MSNIIISTIVFIIAAWWIRRYLDEQGMPHGMTRGLLVFILAYAVSWTSGELVDCAHDKLYGVTQPTQVEQDLNQIVKDAGLALPSK